MGNYCTEHDTKPVFPGSKMRFGRIAIEEKNNIFPALLAKITKGQIHHAFVRPGP